MTWGKSVFRWALSFPHTSHKITQIWENNVASDPNQLLRVSPPFADNTGCGDVEKCCVALRGYSFGQHRLSCAWFLRGSRHIKIILHAKLVILYIQGLNMDIFRKVRPGGPYRSKPFHGDRIPVNNCGYWEKEGRWIVVRTRWLLWCFRWLLGCF